MYLVYAPSSKKKKFLDLLKHYYKKKNLHVEERDLLNYRYLIVTVHPAKVVSDVKILDSLVIEELQTSSEITKALKVRLDSQKIDVGSKVIVVSGKYQGFKGKVNKILQDGKYELLVSVFGFPATIVVTKDEIVLG